MNEVSAIVLALLSGIVIGFIIGRITHNNTGIYEFIKSVYTNLDNLILIISMLVVVGSICFTAIGRLEVFASVVIDIFGSIVFSWILTKKSAREEFKRQQEELALRSYRHINYIESAADTAYKKLETHLKDLGDENSKLILNSAMDQIKYIQGGINTCKLDWLDMLSDEQKKHYSNECDECDEMYGTIEKVAMDADYNQENA